MSKYYFELLISVIELDLQPPCLFRPPISILMSTMKPKIGELFSYCKVPESAGPDHDKTQVITILNVIQPDIIPLDTIRLGASARKILKNKSSNTAPIVKNIRITDDKTPAQMAYLNKVRNELKRRIEVGETGLTIKYIRGIPQIITTLQKIRLKSNIYGFFFPTLISVP